MCSGFFTVFILLLTPSPCSALCACLKPCMSRSLCSCFLTVVSFTPLFPTLHKLQRVCAPASSHSFPLLLTPSPCSASCAYLKPLTSKSLCAYCLRFPQEPSGMTVSPSCSRCTTLMEMVSWCEMAVVCECVCMWCVCAPSCSRCTTLMEMVSWCAMAVVCVFVCDVCMRLHVHGVQGWWRWWASVQWLCVECVECVCLCACLCVWNVWNVCVWLIWLCVHCVNTNPMFPSLDTVCEGVDVWVFAIFPPFVLHLPQVVSH